jgi:hypothetical protein
MSSNNVENNFPYIHETNQDLEKLKNRENQKTSTEKWRDAPPRERERERERWSTSLQAISMRSDDKMKDPY